MYKWMANDTNPDCILLCKNREDVHLRNSLKNSTDEKYRFLSIILINFLRYYFNHVMKCHEMLHSLLRIELVAWQGNNCEAVHGFPKIHPQRKSFVEY